MEWFDEWYWSFERAFHGDAVARQYLTIWGDDADRGTHWERVDKTHPGRVHKMLTTEQARAAGLDVVIATVPHNERGFHRFAGEVGAVYGVQIGNVGQAMETDWERAAFGLLSTTVPPGGPPKPHVIYRQEFSLTDFRYTYPPTEANTVASFVQCFPENRGPERGNFYDQFADLAGELNEELDFRVYGAYGSAAPDSLAAGNLPSTPAVAEAMRGSRMIWHAKFWSDGYGHVIHNAHAVGRPVLSYHNYYSDKLAAPLMEHGVTGFDLSRMSHDEILATLRRLRDDNDYHRQISEQTAKRFRQTVDFDADAEAVKGLLESVT